MKYTHLIASLVAVTLLSCKKDIENVPKAEIQQPLAPVTYPNFSNLKVGNYWIYQRFEIDGAGNETALSFIDSCYIEKDTIIRGNTYYKYVSPDFTMGFSPTPVNMIATKFYRDSLSYLVTNYGSIEFSSNDFMSVFNQGIKIASPNDTLCRYEFKMADQNLSVTAPLGAFVTSNFKETYYMYPHYSNAGTVRSRNTRYSEGVGKVIQEWCFFVNVPTKWESRLIRYHLN